MNHRRNSPLRDCQEVTRNRCPVRIKPGVTDNVGVTLAIGGWSGSQSIPEIDRIKKRLGHNAGVDIHFLIAPPARFDIDHHGWEAPGIDAEARMILRTSSSASGCPL